MIIFWRHDALTGLTWNKSTHICSQLETVGVGDLAHLDPLSPAPSALTNHWGLTLQYNNLILWCNFYYALSSSQGDYVLSKHNFPIFTRPFQRLILIYLKWVDALWKRSYFENFSLSFNFRLTLDNSLSCNIMRHQLTNTSWRLFKSNQTLN